MNMGKGMDGEALSALRRKLSEKTAEDENSGHGIGLKNVHDRIQLAFGKKYGLTIDSEYGHYMRVSLHLPFLTSVIKEEEGDENENPADSRR